MEKEILTALYHATEERTMTDEYCRVRSMVQELKENFIEKVGEQNREELDRLTDMINQLNDILGKEDFCNRILNSSKIVRGKYV